jgi:hypothetical protein
MNATELTAHLQSLSVPPGAYSIGTNRDESYCLLPEGDRWKVYYSERGNRNDESAFADEGAACQELLARLTRDHIVRQRMADDGR